MELRSLSTDGTIVEFRVKDCPVLVKDKYIALFGRENSNLLYQAYLCRGQKLSERLGIVYEGDIVCDELGKELGILFYDMEWRLLDKDNIVKKMPDCAHIKMKGGNVSSLIQLREIIKHRSNITFKYAEKVCSLMSVIGKTEEDSVILSGVNKPMENDQGCMLSTGYFYNNRAVFFGDKVEGYGTVTLYNGVPGILGVSGKFLPLARICETMRR